MNYSSPTPPIPSPAQPPPIRRQQGSIDPSLIAVSKNFAKTANLLINEITAHKLASIFSKALTERDAPGYKKLILRPQDLKTIKAAVNKGSRAAGVAIEEMENQQQTDGDGGETPAPTKASFGSTGAGAGIYFVTKTEDLMPPKGIVNSAQLEMELMRMFANAVMFNPLAGNERGFGGRLRLLRGGGVKEQGEVSKEVEVGETETEDGGIISDTKEMCKDVMELVAKYRRLEHDRMYISMEEAATKGSTAIATTAGQRARSASEHSAFGDEGASVLVDGEGNTHGTSRKRRKIGEA
jgi:Bromodomain